MLPKQEPPLRDSNPSLNSARYKSIVIENYVARLSHAENLPLSPIKDRFVHEINEKIPLVQRGSALLRLYYSWLPLRYQEFF